LEHRTLLKINLSFTEKKPVSRKLYIFIIYLFVKLNTFLNRVFKEIQIEKETSLKIVEERLLEEIQSSRII